MEFLTKEFIYSKSSQEITSLLYEALMDRVREAIDAIEKKDFIEANTKLQKANDILQRLGVGLNYEAGIIADQLDTLYNYMANNLVEANLKKDTTLLIEVLQITESIANAWNEALKNKEKQETQLQRKANAYEQHVAVATQE
ncbi:MULTISPECIES: flagellar export chaperone FliS [Heyndrickxia]|uniref:flagellar export chaperone FliS n=1 Tax=Heyndrickxia TaxID=2837504 RepID=UPI000D3DC5A9|nr:flagellar export chaperone FliS [Heyndrickxia sporothermodurans]MED3650584.1 flagellar export chaperone FliS [Heyndrickxia sporothermodurans]MED3653698.1 flagellar export chaperone FliS [Heyndrickxia sporothermodurans]MED3697348.1 flagellar export chaperone FliS [Heyndrickxia sporothermodurans]MED3780769.1 flagellar export chaperone FliS [Heyndrickxia sporothermodurans]PTY80443.1 flagellar export chaperone FliS [Heyndrickxia sporothermodurans]